MDSYCEQLVAKTRTAGDTAKMVMCIVISLLVAAICVFFMLVTGMAVLLLLAVAAIGVGIWFAGGMGIEYEYMITNDEMDVDKIIGKRKRKRMITVDLNRVTDFEPVPCDIEDFDVVVQASTGLERDAFCMFVEHQDYGKVKIVFNPNRKIRDAIAQMVPKQLRGKVVNDNAE